MIHLPGRGSADNEVGRSTRRLFVSAGQVESRRSTASTPKEPRMFFHAQQLINPIVDDDPDPAAANALQEGLGGQFSEMRTMMQYLFQAFNFRGTATPYRDLIQGIGVEEISHVELIATTISKLLDGAPGFKPNGTPGERGTTPLEIALGEGNIHHFLVGAQGALPVDSAGNPWSGSYVYNSGNLVLDLLYDLMLEATGRLQKCRIYEMTDNKTARATISYLIARDAAHEAAFAKALETLGVSWGKTLPVPKFDATKYPEVKALMDEGVHRVQHHWRVDGSEMSRIFQGPSPLTDQEGVTLETTETPPPGAPIPAGPERPEEFAPGLTPELMEIMEQATKVVRKDRPSRAGGKDGGAERVSEPRDLFLSELADVYYAEKALENVLPKLANESSDAQLTKGFQQHLQQTKKHATNIESIFEALGERPKAELCPGIEGLKQEHDKFMAERDASPEMTDLFIAGAAARTEHYEIAAYNSLLTMARTMGDAKVTRLLQQNLKEEQDALKKVETVAKRLTNGTNGSRTRSRSTTSSSSSGSSKRSTTRSRATRSRR
jgi:Mn-containing catalase